MAAMLSEPTESTGLPAADGLSADLASAASHQAGRVANCLPWNDMSRIPPPYETFAAEHFRTLPITVAVSWQDACPAYALGYLTHTAYGPLIDPADAWEVELQWEDLRGESRMTWPDAFDILRQAWAYLALHR